MCANYSSNVTVISLHYYKNETFVFHSLYFTTYNFVMSNCNYKMTKIPRGFRYASKI